MKTSVIRARCSPELKERVLRYAAQMGLEEADIVRTAVQDYLNRAESTPDGASSLRLHPRPPVSYLSSSPSVPAMNDRKPRSRK